MVCDWVSNKSFAVSNLPVPNITNRPCLRGKLGFSVITGGVVIACLLPLESLA
jgi:hypothetical protein